MDSNNNVHFFQNTLRSIEEYSEAELSEFTKYSLISKSYLRLLNEKNIPYIYQIRHTAWLQCCLASFYDNATNEDIFKSWSQAMDHVIENIRVSTGLDQEPLDLVALGKYGSEVLNLSSDIDVLFISDSQSESIIHKTRNFIKQINQKSEWGFISRVDLNLKPEALKDRYIIPPQSLVNYLWNSTALWERLVYTRARTVFANLSPDSTEDYPQLIKKFCYRKYVNMGLIEDLSSLLQKILTHNHDDQNIKLRPGGIRSLELFFSSLQLLYGGRDPDLHTNHTYELLDVLSQKTYIQNGALITLKNNYDLLRRAENLIQMQTDSQDHSVNQRLPMDNAILDKTCLESRDILMSYMDGIIGNRKKAPVVNLPFEDESSQIDVAKFPHLEGLNSFFSKRPRYKELILSHPKTFKNFLKALKYSPYLSRILLLRPELLDLYLIKKTILDPDADDEMLLSQLVDFKLVNYITALGDFLIHFNVDALTSILSLTSDKSLDTILKKVSGSDSGVRILKLGKWASHEVGLKSDLDFIFLCDSNHVDLKKIRKVIHYIGHHTFYGPFYNIDLRLRPSGSAGPIVTDTQKLNAFFNAPETSTWIKQSYLRNAFLDTGEKFEFKFNHTLAPTPDQKAELLDIRSKRLLSSNSMALSPKQTEGGLIDLEFFIQHICMQNDFYPSRNSFQGIIDELYELKIISSEMHTDIGSTYRYLRTTEQICSLKSTTQDILVTPENALFIFDLPNSSSKFFETPLSYLKLKEMLQHSRHLIQTNHPFLR